MAEIFEAIRAKDLGRLERAANLGAELNDFNAEGYTPLALAVKVGFLKGVEYLLGLADTNANKGRPDGTTPLMISARQDRKHTTALLLAYPSVDANAVNNDGNTALLDAVLHNSKDAFDILLADLYVDFEKANNIGLNPILAAAQLDRPEFVEALLNKGADITERKYGTKTLFELARSGRHTPIVDRMILNKAVFGKTYNAPVGYSDVTPLGGLPSVVIDVYPLNAKARDFFKRRDYALPFPLNYHTVAEAKDNRANFIERMSLVRGMCSGVESHYAMVKLSVVDLYITVSFGPERKLAGFVYATLYPSDKDFFMDLICTRDTTKGTGSLLMKLIISMAIKAGYETMTLESVYSAVKFYESFGFTSDEQSDENLVKELQPMILFLMTVDPASLTFAATAAPSAAASAAPGTGHGAGATASTAPGTGRGGGTRRSGARKGRNTRRKI